jgi:outer membrane protein OmpA-like peptidoglycan-associated protein
MRKILVILVFIFPIAGIGQTPFLNKVKSRTKNQVENRALNKVDKEVDKALDEIENPSETKSTVEKDKSETANEKGGSEGQDIKAYSKYDFVPGEKIVYAEEFGQDEIGELPLNWNTSGKAELVTLDAFSGKWLRLYQNAVYLTSNTDSFTKNFTVEFDLVLQLKNLGYTYPYISFGLLASDAKATNDNSFLKYQTTYQSAEVYIRPSGGGSSSIYTETYADKARHFLAETQNLAAIENYYNKVSHVSMQVQNSRFRVWINGEKKYDLPMAMPTTYIFNQVFFNVHGSSYKDDQLGIFVSNIKIATGKADTRKKLLEEGTFSTTGILFANGSAAIKPESCGVIKEVANVLKSEQAIKIKVIGHTSSDGDDELNLQLSMKRAVAVKEMLVGEFEIDSGRIEADGKGERQPVGDNKTSEGKTQNRRVEFIKL